MYLNSCPRERERELYVYARENTNWKVRKVVAPCVAGNPVIVDEIANVLLTGLSLRNKPLPEYNI